MLLKLKPGVADRIRLTSWLRERGYEFDFITLPDGKGKFSFLFTGLECPAYAEKRLGTYKIADTDGNPLKPADLKSKFSTLPHND